MICYTFNNKQETKYIILYNIALFGINNVYSALNIIMQCYIAYKI